MRGGKSAPGTFFPHNDTGRILDDCLSLEMEFARGLSVNNPVETFQDPLPVNSPPAQGVRMPGRELRGQRPVKAEKSQYLQDAPGAPRSILRARDIGKAGLRAEPPGCQLQPLRHIQILLLISI